MAEGVLGERRHASPAVAPLRAAVPSLTLPNTPPLRSYCQALAPIKSISYLHFPLWACMGDESRVVWITRFVPLRHTTRPPIVNLLSYIMSYGAPLRRSHSGGGRGVTVPRPLSPSRVGLTPINRMILFLESSRSSW